MSDWTVFLILLLLGGTIFLTIAVYTGKLTTNNIRERERIARRRHSGAIMALIGLLWCVPNAHPIVFDWMQPLLIPMALGCAFIAWWVLDYLFARAFGGLAILTAYTMLHGSFTFHLPGHSLFALLSIILGSLGIVISARPNILRDIMRKCAADKYWRWSVSGYFAVFGIAALVTAAMLAFGS